MEIFVGYPESAELSESVRQWRGSEGSEGSEGSGKSMFSCWYVCRSFHLLMCIGLQLSSSQVW
jgi:hypothetical protein